MSDEHVFKGPIKVGNLSFPTTDGANGDVLTTDGAGNISLQTPSGGSGGGSVERVRVNYTAGFDIDTIADQTGGVTSTINNSTDAIMSQTFTGHSYPPASIIVYAFDVANGQYTLNVPDGSWSATRLLQGNDTEFGSFNGPIQLQVDEINLSGLNNDGLTGPHAFVLFWFQD